MIKRIVIFLLALLVVSCNFSKEKNLIPRDKFVSILTDMHLAEGYYATHGRETKNHNDSTFNFYNTIFKNYGYTRADFDTTLKYYTVHSQEFDLLYEDVVTELNKTEQENYQIQPQVQFAQNIWSGKNSWYLPQEGKLKKIPINLKLRGKGKYIVSFTCKTFTDDESQNPRLTLYFENDGNKTSKTDTLTFISKTLSNDTLINPWLTSYFAYVRAETANNDSFCYTCRPSNNNKSKHGLILYLTYNKTEIAERDTFKTVIYNKDSRTMLISVSKSLENNYYTHLRGFLLDNDNKPESGSKHVILEGFKVQFVSSAGL